MNPIRFSFAPTALIAALAVAPTLQAASFEHFHGDTTHAETGGFTATTNGCPSGGFVTVGTSVDNHSTSAVLYAVRTAADGATLWRKTYALGNGGVQTEAVVGLRNGSGFVVGGETSPGPQAFLMKIDCNGVPVWASSYSGQTGFQEVVSGVVEVANGDLVVSGFSIDDRNDIDTTQGLLFRTDAAGALRWSRIYNAGDFTAFRAITTADERDVVVIGDRMANSRSQSHPLVLRLGADGRLNGARHCAAEYKTWAFGLGVTELSASRHAGEFVVSGETLGTTNDLLLVRTDEDVCRPAVARIIAAAASASIAEVKRPLPGAARGTLALPSALNAGSDLPSDAVLLTVSPSTLVPLSGHLFGDHATETTATTHSALARTVVPLADGFVVTGDSTSSDISVPDLFQDSDLYVVKTDDHGDTTCSASRLPSSQAARVPVSRVRVSSTSAGLAGATLADVTVADQTVSRTGCQ
jgi:hypothetical protein